MSSSTPNPLHAGGPIVPVILSGGSGTRLWPVSRESFPKQLWPLVSDRTMLQETACAALGPGSAPPVIVCNQEHRFLIAEQMRSVGIDGADIVLEPVGRNSAPAITAAALLVAEREPEAVLWMMAADAVDPAAGCAACGAGPGGDRGAGGICRDIRHAAAPGGDGVWLYRGRPGAGERAGRAPPVALPRETECRRGGGVRGVQAAPVELGHVRVQGVDAAGGNAGLCAAGAGGGAASGGKRTQDLDFIRLDPAAFAACPNISLDYAVAEQTARAAVVPADLGWSDVGSWDALWEQSPKDGQGNVAVGDVLLEGSSNCFVRSDGIVTAVVGLDDAVVVVTADAVLAMHRGRAQDVKRVVDRLRANGRHEAVAHNRVYRPWGFYESLILGDRFQVKRIVVKPGQKLSLQKHFHRAEHWVVVTGAALVTRDGEEVLIQENQSIYLPLGCVHRMENPGRIPLTLIEVQSGSYLGEDDIVRIEDTYGRA